jgi:hypothetical protein
MTPDPQADAHNSRVLAALGRRLAGRHDDSSLQAADLVACARENQVHLLMAGALRTNEPSDAALRAELREEYHEAAARDATETAALRGLLQIAFQHGVRPLLYKGAALAHRVYERSWERPRSDADLLIAETDEPLMRRALEAAGYERAWAVDGALVTRQFQYCRASPPQPEQHVDVHTRLFNPVAFADALNWADADARAVALPALGPTARTLSDSDALLVACLHRVAHHHDAPRLIWLCDIDRLARRLDAGDWETFVSSAARARVRAVCGSSLTAATALFDTPVPATVASSLAAAVDEPSASFLGRGAGELRVQWLNLRHLSGWRARASLLRQHLFPAPAYVLEKYGRRNRAWLPVLYARRVLGGFPRWLRSQRS